MKSDSAVTLGRHRLPLRSALLAGVLLLQLAPEAFARARPAPASQSCNWNAAIGALALMSPQKGVVMTELWSGPEILWRSDFSVVGAPYEIAPALADTARFETGTSFEARQVLERRHIQYVLTCGARSDARLLGLYAMRFAAPGFHLYRVMQ